MVPIDQIVFTPCPFPVQGDRDDIIYGSVETRFEREFHVLMTISIDDRHNFFFVLEDLTYEPGDIHIHEHKSKTIVIFQYCSQYSQYSTFITIISTIRFNQRQCVFKGTGPLFDEFILGVVPPA